MRRKSEFARRITIVSSVLLSLAWFVFVGVASRGFNMRAGEFLIVVVIGIFIFFIPILLRKTIDWLQEGIDKDKEARLASSVSASDSGTSTRSNLPPEMIKCPYCAEMIRADAVKCKYCQETFSGW